MSLLAVLLSASLTFSTVENENSSSSANKNCLGDSVISVSNTVADSQFQKMEADAISDSVLVKKDTTKEVVTPKVKYSWFGKCTHYADKYHGRRTATGEVFSQNKLTAAKSTFNTMNLPYGSKVRVTNLDNNKSVIVKINDNGPFKGNSTKNNLDLSKSAYLAINIKGKDLFNVKFEVLEK